MAHGKMRKMVKTIYFCYLQNSGISKVHYYANRWVFEQLKRQASRVVSEDKPLWPSEVEDDDFYAKLIDKVMFSSDGLKLPSDRKKRIKFLNKFKGTPHGKR